MNLIFHSLAYPVGTLGPGRRVAVWTAGCRKNCPGCLSPDMQAASSGRPIPTGKLARRVAALALPLDGLTLSGGEPLDQGPAVSEFLMEVKALKPGWNIMLYSGFSREEIRRTAAGPAVLDWVDLLVDGPYDRDRPAANPWAGSGNQGLHALTPEGRDMLSRAGEDAGELEFGLGPRGRARLIGVGNASWRFQCLAFLEKREQCRPNT
ncbi:MAG: 4Fe-4S single cluster domain-containing protein [Pseudomonadota bacterium]